MAELFAPLGTDEGDARATLVPEVVGALVEMGLVVKVQPGLGAGAGYVDGAYEQAGAELVSDVDAAWASADVLAVVGAPADERVRQMKQGAVLVGLLSPVTALDVVRACVDGGVTAVAMEFIPRISRAQSMDALSSQASIAGYKAAVMAADRCPKMLPMMMTAAGTLSPAKAFVIGAGVAGLQAIATLKRLGANVEAFDVRAATKEQIQSLGARFVEMDLGADAEAAGGYAKELTQEQKAKQAELMAKHVEGADVVVTTAAVFGKAPPVLVPAEVVQRMQPGAVLIDLGASAAYGHGNCALTKPGEEVVTEQGVRLVGTLNLPALVPNHASLAYANNIKAVLKALVVGGQVKLDLEDEVQDGAVVVHDGEVRNELVNKAMA